MKDEVKHDKSGMRFYMPVEVGEAYVSYRMEDDETIDFHETFTSPNLRGKGMAAKVVEAALEYAREENLEVVPTCPYVKKYMEKNGYTAKED